MNLVSIFIFFCIIKSCAAWYAALEATPGVIHPVLTKTLQVRCSIKKHSLNSTIETLQGNVHKRSLSQGFHFDHLLSIMITKVNHVSGENETIASVTRCSTPVIEKSFLNIVQVEGSTEESPEKDEQGYLRLTWDRPNDRQAASYSCEVLFLAPGKHSRVISTSPNVVYLDPKISDLVTYISDTEKIINQLTRQVNELQAKYIKFDEKIEKQVDEIQKNSNITAGRLNEVHANYTLLAENINNQVSDVQKNLNKTSTIINNKLNNLKGQNSLSGSFGCDVKNNIDITFSKPFLKVPTVYLMIEYLYVGQTGLQFATDFYYVNTTGFGINCGEQSLSEVYYRYLAIDL